MAMLLALACAATCLLSLALVRPGIGYSRRTMLDVPCERSSHSRPTPTGGGAGFVAAFFLSGFVWAFLLDDFSKPSLYWLLGLSLPLCIVGFLDDRKGLPALLRLLAHLLVSAAGVAWLMFLNPPPDLAQPWLFLVAGFAVIAVTGVINITNFMDGMDGLVAGSLAVAFSFFGWWLAESMWWLLTSALLGFLFWNWSPAKIFMGDVGSTALGGLAAVAGLRVLLPSFTAETSTLARDWPFLAVFLPVLGDGVYTLTRRALKGENILKAHHSHIYQRLMRSGLGHSPIAASYIAFTLVLGLLASFFHIWGACAGLALFLAALLWSERRIQRAGVPFRVPSRKDT